ncbi:hypothetical protein AMAG_02510 [Allomyces macrogynus ATCC 38327]|uniref:Carbonic anhydrase n=1 Tax=Allomyces macrogynus (strain ATCC 38327) TaxID=578462 RepID=A0A0L0S2U8_ALLM3|nr:hypothetical protein AMAG_02510 [Allomyces macrogynus ATCC 38327]|eukprot:KNE56730.1 hypothetical protein AMAG_02510 [Allomyces macrogynus ATCC 38327]
MAHFPSGEHDLDSVLAANRAWAARVSAEDPDFFHTLAGGQHPKILWIGCSDSRVPPSEICGLHPGELFVHRNIANVCPHSDTNLLAVVQYAVQELKVEHIVVAGHYGCGGVNAAMDPHQHNGAIDDWLMHVRDVYHAHRKRLEAVPAGEPRANLLVEVNVVKSAFNLAHTPIVQKAWARGQKVAIHGWVYRLEDGIIKDLGLLIDGAHKIDAEYRMCAARGE